MPKKRLWWCVAALLVLAFSGVLVTTSQDPLPFEFLSDYKLVEKGGGTTARYVVIQADFDELAIRAKNELGSEARITTYTGAQRVTYREAQLPDIVKGYRIPILTEDIGIIDSMKIKGKRIKSLADIAVRKQKGFTALIYFREPTWFDRLGNWIRKLGRR